MFVPLLPFHSDLAHKKAVMPLRLYMGAGGQYDGSLRSKGISCSSVAAVTTVPRYYVFPCFIFDGMGPLRSLLYPRRRIAFHCALMFRSSVLTWIIQGPSGGAVFIINRLRGEVESTSSLDFAINKFSGLSVCYLLHSKAVL